MNARSFPLALFAFATVSAALQAQEVLKEQGTEWSFLLFKSAINNAIDPANIDADFHSTWFDPINLGYDGPPFVPGTGYFGYGVINAQPITTNIWNPDGSLVSDTPPADQRYSAYFLTTVTPTQPVSALRFTGIIDDGAIIYVNGTELTRINMLPDPPDAWDLFSDGGGDEDNPVSAAELINLPANQPALIAVSLHSVNETSSDLGFDLTIEAVLPTRPDNDDFANAAVIPSGFDNVVTGNSGNGFGGVGATVEPGEPEHAGDAGGASIWWSWTPDTSGRVSLSTEGSTFATLLAVYTGNAVDSLTPVFRYAHFNTPASSAGEPFYPASRVEFDAEAGTTYYIAVDGAGAGWGDTILTMAPNFTFLDPLAELLPAGSDWEYLLLVSAANLPVDPDVGDLDYDTTWQTKAFYDGPTFSGPAPAPFGYGTINAGPVATDLWGGLDHDGDGLGDAEPPTGLRYTVYFRTSFTPAEPVQHVGFEGLIDDGAILYLDGVEVARMNVDAAKDANDWATFADGTQVNGVNDENAPQVAFALDQNLPAGQPVEIAVSLHNASATSSDLGFNLRVYSVNTPPNPPAPTSFWVDVDQTAQAGEYEVTWPATGGSTYLIQWSGDGISWQILATGVAADPGGINIFLDTPGTPAGLYRVTDETTVP